jgi:DNA polymerase (family X)
MDPRTVSHVLSRIGLYLELRGEPRFKARAYTNAARAISTLPTDDIRPLLESGELEALRGVGPATLSVVRELVESGESSYLLRLRESTPEGLLELLRVPGLSTEKILKLHSELGISGIDDLEQAARDGRLAELRGFGAKTAARILKGISVLAGSGARMLLHIADAAAIRAGNDVAAHPGVARVEVAGSVRRRNEVIADIDIVAACTEDPEEVAQSFARAPGVSESERSGAGSCRLTYVDGQVVDLHCVPPPGFAIAYWRATGNERHVEEIAARLAERGIRLDGDTLRNSAGDALDIDDERQIYAAAGLPWIPPEMREGRGELDLVRDGEFPKLLTFPDIRGVLHCHSTYSDGKGTVEAMAAAARQRGWSYIGISDHSVSAFYAGGLKPEQVREQHAEIDELNSRLSDSGFRVLKGIEADILADGRVDYDEEVLASFDYVIASIHSRFSMDEATMTERIVTALENPHVTILAHPTGRLLLNREPYAVDLEAVFEKAAEEGVAVELNADPHRLDIDWRYLPDARARGITIEIGPDAHSAGGLDNIWAGIAMARKGGLQREHVLNTGSADDVLAFARKRRR